MTKNGLHPSNNIPQFNRDILEEYVLDDDKRNI